MYEYLLFSKLNNNNNIIVDIFILIFIIPLFKIFSIYVENNYESILNKFKKKEHNTVVFTGWNTLKNGFFYFDYPLPMNAICQYVVKNNLSNKVKYINIERNSVFFNDYFNKTDNNLNYILDEKENIKITNDIEIDFTSYRINGKDKDSDTAINTWKIELTVKSKKLSITHIHEFIENIIKDYEKSKQKQILYHFIYQGWDDERSIPKFSQNILSNLENDDEKSFETFDTLFSEHKEKIIKSIDRLKDIDYFKKTGFKRKIGYLFYGPPGCGKTSHVIAMANYSKSHIIEVPLSRVHNNKEIEGIINITKIDDMEIVKDKIIILFDEIDQIEKVLNKEDVKIVESDNKNNITTIKSNTDSLSLGYILSRLDGVGNYNGIKIVATTNHKDKLSPALYRDGRLTPLFFDLSNRNNIRDIIQYYYNSEINIEEIPEFKMPPSTLKKYLEDFQYDKEGLIKFLKNYFNSHKTEL